MAPESVKRPFPLLILIKTTSFSAAIIISFFLSVQLDHPFLTRRKPWRAQIPIPDFIKSSGVLIPVINKFRKQFPIPLYSLFIDKIKIFGKTIKLNDDAGFNYFVFKNFNKFINFENRNYQPLFASSGPLKLLIFRRYLDCLETKFNVK